MSRSSAIFALFATVLVAPVMGQPSEEMRQKLQQKVAVIKESMAQNKASLKTYQWVETTEISLKGDVKKREQKECRYDPDGKVQKTTIGGSSDQKEEKGRRRGRRRGRLKKRIIEKKVAELKDYGDRFGSLIRHYAPPDPDRLKVAVQSGNASLDRSAGVLTFRNYYKEGDQLNLIFDPAARKLRTYSVKTYLDGQEDRVNVNVNFNSLQDGTNYMGETLLESTGKKLGIKITNSSHKKIQ